MNDKKFCFIICSNSKLFFDECIQYINRLIVPAGYEVEILEIADAVCMTGGYNEGMMSTDAKYKIYMHQDVFIVYPYFLQAVLDIFASGEDIGMIGMVGAEQMSPDGVMWHGYRRGNLAGQSMERCYDYKNYRYFVADGYWDVDAIDGLMMITSRDIPWRQDLFDGWDFYDVSQSFEMKRNGYRVVVPKQEIGWCIHDDGILNLFRYNQYRLRCLNEYKEFLGSMGNE